jgi:peptide deformylase
VPVREITLFPNPILREKAASAVPQTEDALAVVQDLWDTLDSHTGVGIAAPQIGVSTRIIAIDATRAKRPVENHGRLALLNPVIVERSGQTSFREGCLSIPDLVARVKRAEQVTVSATLPDGSPITFTSTGFEAVILQHEIDHLDGVLFIDRVHSARDIKIRS